MRIVGRETPRDYKAVSGGVVGEQNRPGLGFVEPNHSIFTAETLVGETNPRNLDAEFKIFSEAANDLLPGETRNWRELAPHPAIHGELNVYSEIPMCGSCYNVVGQWEKVFPNVFVNIHYGPPRVR